MNQSSSIALGPVSTGRGAALTLGALGIVFGDIGTSPIYALKECFHAGHGIAINHDNVVGILSLIFWALTIVVSLKYIAFIMRADNNGEGGVMALLALTLRAQLGKPGHKFALLSIGIFGAALFFGDGVITPAISVLSAVEGLRVVTPSLDAFVLPITIAILIALFAIQRYGTCSIGALFGPVMLLWFATLALLGVINIGRHPDVLHLFNPAWAIRFFELHGPVAFVVLGAVVLTVTGGEALYADMGHFGRRPIHRAWFLIVLPALLLNYCGQGALLMAEPEAVENPFFLLAPRWLLVPLIALATLATVIASQAVISGVFSIASQAIQLGYLPRLLLQHTSAKEIGQIYLPAVNWALLIVIVALVLLFRTSSSLASAYGVAVTLTMVCDVVLAGVVATTLWRWRPLPVLLMVLPLLLIDLAFFGATVLKILHGGWFPLLLGAVMFAVMSTWKRGRQILQEQLGRETMPLALLIGHLSDTGMQPVAGTAVFLTSNLETVPHALLHNMKHNKVLHELNVLLTVVTADVPYIGDQQRLQVEQVGDNFWRIIGRYGFKEEPNIPQLLALCMGHGLDFKLMETSFFLSRERIAPGQRIGMARWRELLFQFMFRNAAPASDYFHIPANRVVELGSQLII